jgi:hypothetical protein
VPALIELTGSPDRVVTIADAQTQQLGATLTSGGTQRSWEALADAPEAHRISEQGHVRGKLVLFPE